MVSVAERPTLPTQPDSVILAAAQAEGRVVVTEDAKDFRPLGLAEMSAGRPYPRSSSPTTKPGSALAQAPGLEVAS